MPGWRRIFPSGLRVNGEVRLPATAGGWVAMALDVRLYLRDETPKTGPPGTAFPIADNNGHAPRPQSPSNDGAASPVTAPPDRGIGEFRGPSQATRILRSMPQARRSSDLTPCIAAAITTRRANCSTQQLFGTTAESGTALRSHAPLTRKWGGKLALTWPSCSYSLAHSGCHWRCWRCLSGPKVVEMLPGQELDTLSDAKWLVGLDLFPGDASGGDVPAVREDFQARQLATASPYNFRRHQDGVAYWLVAHEDNPEAFRRAMFALRWSCNSMRRAGLTGSGPSAELNRAATGEATTSASARTTLEAAEAHCTDGIAKSSRITRLAELS